MNRRTLTAMAATFAVVLLSSCASNGNVATRPFAYGAEVYDVNDSGEVVGVGYVFAPGVRVETITDVKNISPEGAPPRYAIFGEAPRSE